MTPLISRRRNVGLLLLVSSFCLASSSAQSVTPAQQTVCDHHGEGARCQQLVLEFYVAHGLLTAAPTSVPLDMPTTDTVAFADRIAPKALQLQLTTELRAETKQAAQAALQTISTTAAVSQVGGSPSTTGSTNLVNKPTMTDFISMAAEAGAFTDTLNGSAVTLQANALGLTKYMANQPVFERWNSQLADRVQPLNVTASFNLTQNSSSSISTFGSANSLTPSSIAAVMLPSNNASLESFGVNYSVYRPYNPQDKNFLANWTKAVAANKAALASTGEAIAKAMNALFTPAVIKEIIANLSTPLSEWHNAGAAAERSGNFDAFVSAYAVYDDAFGNYILSRPDAPKNVLALSQALDAFNAATYTVLSQARGTPLASIRYLYSTPAQKPSTHDFTIALAELFHSGAQLTGNFTASVYATLPSGAKYRRFRDVQLSTEFDRPFGGTAVDPRGVFSLAGYGQYQYDPTVLNITQGNIVPGTNIALPVNAQVLLGTAGWLGIVQGKLVFNLKKGLSIPVAIKWSNKTDLVSKSDVRGQLGISYDLSALSKLVSGAD